MQDFFKQLEERTFRYKNTYANCPKWAMTHLLIWNFRGLFKKWHTPKQSSHITPRNNLNGILFDLQGGIGDIIISLNYLIQLHQKSNCDIKFYLTVPDVMRDSTKLLISKYDIFELYTPSNTTDIFIARITLCRIPNITYISANDLQKKSEYLHNWLQHILSFNKQYPEYLNSGTTSDYLCTQYTKTNGRNRLSMADIDNLVNISSIYNIPTESDAEILSKYGLCANQYITLQCGIGALSGNGLSTREWPIERYNELINLMHQQGTTLPLVQIGNAPDPQMDTDIDLRGKTSFNEMLVILKNAKLHIGGESGCIHMRHFMGARPSVVIFGPTSMEFYAYPENINISSDICSGCEWLHNHWREFCIKTHSCIPACMQIINSETVFEKIKTKII